MNPNTAFSTDNPGVIDVTGSIEFVRTKNLVTKIILVDGLTRAGKSMIGPILGSFENVEIERVEAIFEYIALLTDIGKLDRNAAKILLQLEADTKLYESMIGRNTNFRIKDHSSVFNCPGWWRFIRKLFKPEGTQIVKEIKEKRVAFQVQTHDTLSMIDPFFDAFEDKLAIIEMIRDPVDLIFSWFKRGWGERFAADELAFTFSIRSNSDVAPWYDLIIDGNYHFLSPMDRVIYMIEALQNKSLQKYYELKNIRRKQILWLVFEEFVTKPYLFLPHIETRFGLRRSKYTSKALIRARCPRKLDATVQKQKHDFIKQKASSKAINKIENLYDWYNTVKSIAEKP